MSRDGLDDVTQEVLGDLAIAVATKSERIATVGDRDDCNDGFREILASIADQQISLGGSGGVDLPHFLDVTIDPAIDEVRGWMLRYLYRS